MTEIHVAVVDGAHRCYRTSDGITREYFGPRFAGPRLAGQYADLAAGRPISPLRHPVTRRADELGSFPPLPSEEVRLSLGSPDVGVTSRVRG